MDLILWRHCDAVGSAPDALRPLTPRGHDEARRMARWLMPRLPQDCRIVVSPAVRARQTVQALHRHYEIEPALAPGASIAEVLAVAGWPAAPATTLLVGHEPDLSQVLHDLTGARVQMKKGGLAGVALQRSIGGEMLALLRPRELRRLARTPSGKTPS